jgi:hypothetical protein
MDMQHGQAAWTSGMDKRHGHAAWISSRDVQHRQAVWICGMDMQVYISKTCSKDISCSFDMGLKD